MRLGAWPRSLVVVVIEFEDSGVVTTFDPEYVLEEMDSRASSLAVKFALGLVGWMH